MERETALQTMNRGVVDCRDCPRLVDWRERVARNRVRRFHDQVYWGRPVPGFGDPEARLLVVGLAPAAHGANRTGRMFTGDDSGSFLMKALHEAGFANRPSSDASDDGLALHDAYVTSAVRCAPPDNRPSLEEARACARFLHEEIAILQPQVVVALGRFAFDAVRRELKERGLETSSWVFGHGAVAEAGGMTVIASYHPSRQNTQTGRLTPEMLGAIFASARTLLSDKR